MTGDPLEEKLHVPFVNPSCADCDEPFSQGSAPILRERPKEEFAPDDAPKEYDLTCNPCYDTYNEKNFVETSDIHWKQTGNGVWSAPCRQLLEHKYGIEGPGNPEMERWGEIYSVQTDILQRDFWMPLTIAKHTALTLIPFSGVRTKEKNLEHYTKAEGPMQKNYEDEKRDERSFARLSYVLDLGFVTGVAAAYVAAAPLAGIVGFGALGAKAIGLYKRSRARDRLLKEMKTEDSQIMKGIFKAIEDSE